MRKTVRICRELDSSTSFYYQFTQNYRQFSEQGSFENLGPQVKFQIFEEHSNCLSDDHIL